MAPSHARTVPLQIGCSSKRNSTALLDTGNRLIAADLADAVFKARISQSATTTLIETVKDPFIRENLVNTVKFTVKNWSKL